MPTFEVAVATLKADQQTFEFVYPSKAPLNAEAVGVTLDFKESLAPGLGLLPIALVLRNVGNDLMIEAQFPRRFSVKACIHVEVAALDRHLAPLQVSKDGAQVGT